MSTAQAKTHEHRPLHWTHAGWTHCILPAGYLPFDARGRRHTDQAHGGIVILQCCTCGADRLVEANAGRRNYGPWRSTDEPSSASVSEGR